MKIEILRATILVIVVNLIINLTAVQLNVSYTLKTH